MQRQKLTDQQAVREYYTGEKDEAELTDHQQERLRRVRLCVSLLLGAQPHFQVIGKLIRFFGISQATAYADLRITKHLFGNILKGNKEMWRAMAVEMAISDRQAAILAGDLRARNTATSNFIKASGIENEDPDIPDFSKLRPSVIVTLLPPGTEHKIDELLKGGAIDLNQMPQTIDIEHEEVDTRTGETAEGKDQ